MEKENVKRGRGRPRKEVKVIDNVPKKRGRPRKNPLPITNTVITNTTNVVTNDIENAPKKRGRPKKTHYLSKYEKEMLEATPIPTKIGKVVGYCPDCHTSIADLDIVEGKENVYGCFRCHKEFSRSKLLEVKPVKDTIKYRSKREYLEDYLKVTEDFITTVAKDTVAPEELGKIGDLNSISDSFDLNPEE